MATHFSILPGESHGQRSLVGHSPWGRAESDTECLSDVRAHIHTHTHTHPPDVQPSPTLREAFPSRHQLLPFMGEGCTAVAQLTVLSGPGMGAVAPAGLGSRFSFFKYL